MNNTSTTTWGVYWQKSLWAGSTLKNFLRILQCKSQIQTLQANFVVAAKGQLILKINSQLLNRKQNKNIFVFLPLPQKRGQIKKIRALNTTYWMIAFWLSYTTFLIWPLLIEARVEILTKILLVFFWSISRHQKVILELIDL